MLSTAGLDPVAQEFCGAGVPGCRGSEFSPVSAECPSAMMPRSGAAAEAVPLGDPALPYSWQWTRAPDRTAGGSRDQGEANRRGCADATNNLHVFPPAREPNEFSVPA